MPMASPDPPTTVAAPTATTSSAATATSSASTTTATTTTTALARSFSPHPPPLPPLTVDPMPIVRYPAGQPPHPLPYSTIRVPNSQLSKPHEPPPGVLYPVASSGRGFIPKPLRVQSPHHNTVTIANPGTSFPPRSAATAAAAFAHQARPFGFPQSDLNRPVHSTRTPHLHPSHVGVAGIPGSAPIKGVPVSAHPKVTPSAPSVSDCNGYKDSRDRNRDNMFLTVRDRKVRISDGGSVYALCRSWLRNGFSEETQPQHYDSMKSLPRPLPIPSTDPNMLKKKEDSDEEEDVESVENLLPQDLLQRHIKRAKKVRARLREQRLKRIARYKTRLALLLPPPVEQFRNDTGAGN